MPAPDPGEGEVLVDVEAIGINYRDVYERKGGGYGSAPPAIIGVEGAGKIHDTGERVAWVARCRQLRRAGRGAARAARAGPRRRLHRGGRGGAAAGHDRPLPGRRLLPDRSDGDWVLVHAAAGGVGLLLTQIAKSAAGG